MSLLPINWKIIIDYIFGSDFFFGAKLPIPMDYISFSFIFPMIQSGNLGLSQASVEAQKRHRHIASPKH